MQVSINRSLKTLAVAAVAALSVSACGGGDIDAKTSQNASANASNSAQAGKCGTINMAVNPWVGYEASAYVVGELAKSKLG